MSSFAIYNKPFNFPDQKPFDFERVQQIQNQNPELNKYAEQNQKKIIFLKDLKNERRAIKSNRTKDNSPNLELIKNTYDIRNNILSFKEKAESYSKNMEISRKEDLSLDQKHIRMSDLEALEENWKQMKINHDHSFHQQSGKPKLATKNYKDSPNDKESINSHENKTKYKFFINQKESKKETTKEPNTNNPSKILRHLVPRSRINLQVQEEINLISKSLNENDLLKSCCGQSDAGHEDSNKTINTQREFHPKEIENILQLELSVDHEKKSQEPVKKELKNQLYMKTIFEKYSNIYQKKVPEATKIGKIVNFDKSFNSLNGDETPKVFKLTGLVKKKENVFKEDASDKESYSFMMRNPPRKTSVELDEGKERLRKLFSSKTRQNEDKKREVFLKDQKILLENKDLDNSKSNNELKMAKMFKESKKAKENLGYAGQNKHKRQLSNTLLKLKKTLN